MMKLMPHTIDKDQSVELIRGSVFGFSHTLLDLQTNEEMKARRKAIVGEMGLNKTSQYYQLMLDEVQSNFQEWTKGKRVNVGLEAKNILFSIMMKILFGSDWAQKIKAHTKTEANGETKEQGFQEGFITIFFDCIGMAMKPINSFFPFLLDNGIGGDNKRHLQNCKTLFDSLRDFTKESDDENSILRRVMSKETEGVKEEDVFQDLIIFLMASFESIAHTVTGVLHQFTKTPKIREKVKREVENALCNDLHTEITPEDLSTDNFDKLSYTQMVVKEVLRMNSPGIRSATYRALHDFMTEDEVEIPSGTFIQYNSQAAHYHTDQWQKP